MKRYIIIPTFYLISFGIFATGASSQSLRDVERVMKDPPSISVDAKKVIKIPAGSAVVVESKDFVSFIEITAEEASKKATYSFRTYSRIHKVEISGKGSVHENYYAIEFMLEGKTEHLMIDKGSVKYVDAGLFRAEWAAPNSLYFNENEATMNTAGVKEYEKLRDGLSSKKVLP